MSISFSVNGTPAPQGSDLEYARRIHRFIAPDESDEDLVYTVIPGDPPSKSRPRFTKKGRTYTPQKDRDLEARTGKHLAALVDSPASGNVAVGCVFFRPNRQRIDTDNMIKHVCDAATGVLWVDDSQATAVVGFTEYDPDAPRTIVVLAKHSSTLKRGSDLDKNCAICGKTFTVLGANPKKRVCSTACATRLKGHRPLHKPIPCEHCGRDFIRVSQYRRLCSPECRASSLRKARAVNAAPFAQCIDCGKTLTHKRGGRCRECWRKTVSASKEWAGSGELPGAVIRISEIQNKENK